MSADGCGKDDVTVARDALAQGDLRHAITHLANAIADDPEREERLALLAKVFANADDPLALVPIEEGKPTYFGIVALRAWLLASRGEDDEAARLLLNVMVSTKELTFLPWLSAWVARGKVAPETLGFFFPAWEKAAGSPDDYLDALPLVYLIKEAHPAHPVLRLLQIAFVRRAGDLEGALREGLEALEKIPGYHLAASVATSYGELGQTEKAIEYFRKALEYSPDELGARLDLGDRLLALGRLDESAQAYEEVLKRAPKHPWAEPSLACVRVLRSKDEKALDRLRKLAATNERARYLLGQLASPGDPYVTVLPDPVDATVNAWEQLLDAFERGKLKMSSGPLKLDLSHLEAPSNSLVAGLMRPKGFMGELQIQVDKVAQPDARKPKGEVAWLLWKYKGKTPERAVAAPTRGIPKKVAAIAKTEFKLDAWWDAAAGVAREVGIDEVPSLVATMVYPPPLPPDVKPWSWILAVQVAAALVIARIDEGWEGSKRREVLDALARGPVDWSVTAAVVALAKLAIEHEPAREHVRALLERLLEQRGDDGHCCYEYAVVCLLPKIPGLDAVKVQALAKYRADIEANGR